MSEKWWGKYYQSGLGDIIISQNHMTTKGICINQTKDFYVFFNRSVCFFGFFVAKVNEKCIFFP